MAPSVFLTAKQQITLHQDTIWKESAMVFALQILMVRENKVCVCLIEKGLQGCMEMM